VDGGTETLATGDVVMVLMSDIDLSITLLDSMRHSSIRAADAGIGASELSDSGLLVVKIVCCAPFGAETSVRMARLEAAPFQGKINNQNFSAAREAVP
jgi:hypothetical protein